MIYNAGDRVEIINGSYKEFIGMTGEVIEVDGVYGPKIYPDWDRPDGYGRVPFYWEYPGDRDKLRRIR